MSTIDTNGMNVNYPVPGENNSTQGFRDNFSNIKKNLDAAAKEISDIQGKAVLTEALDGLPIDNNMNGTLISTALTRAFRSTTYNLGNNLQGTVVIDVTRADIQYGTITGNVNFSFSSWSPVNTNSQVILSLTVSNSTAVITFPSQVDTSAILENSIVDGNNLKVTAPYENTVLEYRISTKDCGSTISIEPLNRPYQSTQVIYRSPSPTGEQGDVSGTVAVDDSYVYVCTGDYDATIIESPTLRVVSTNATGNIITLASDAAAGGVVLNMPVIFDSMETNGTSVINFGKIEAGKVYYVKTISGSNITISATRTSGTAGTALTLTTVSSGVDTGADTKFYDGSNIWKRIPLQTW